jgi:hypothetical protein
MFAGFSGRMKFSLLGGLLLWVLGRSVFAAEPISVEHAQPHFESSCSSQ